MTTKKEIELANEIAKDDLIKRNIDVWAEKEKELEKVIANKYGSIDATLSNARLYQLRECKDWHDKQLEEHTQRCAKDMIQQNLCTIKDLKEAFEKKRDEELKKIKKEVFETIEDEFFNGWADWYGIKFSNDQMVNKEDWDKFKKEILERHK